ncbi:DUF3261 domain-containing protein [Pseudoalteromonas sp. MMG010]|uniref:DUF3261 domain-containing protein n=1 Tax=Pseudoalteromonas sp. MMG010 TaxID=2822685 RepID=UPI001B3A5D0A|nr:DUF3261 domain-containing protein [Pseudoalteromonas sp. MMG010]MBQ4833470.1 DUF3261 domain-containing protein [Pseudoalteromonas sp. MMG010]
MGYLSHYKLLVIAFYLFTLVGCESAINSRVKAPALFSLMPITEQLVGRGWLESFTFSGVVEHSLIVSTEFEQHIINVAALTPEGMPISQLKFDSNTGQFINAEVLNAALDPTKVIYDMQSAFWPIDAIRRAAMANVAVEQVTKNGQLTRLFYRNNALIREITYNGALTQLTEHEQQYRLNIQRLEEY